MINKDIEKIKKADSGIRLVEAFKELFCEKDGEVVSESLLAQRMGLDVKVFSTTNY